MLRELILGLCDYFLEFFDFDYSYHTPLVRLLAY